MAVHLRIGQRAGEHEPQPSKRPAELSLADRRTISLAPEIIARQKAGHITSRQLCESLKADGILQASGKAWAEATVFRMLKRGRKLGLPFVLRSKARAASERVPDQRSLDTRRAEQKEADAKLLHLARSKMAENDALITSIRFDNHPRGESRGRT